MQELLAFRVFYSVSLVFQVKLEKQSVEDVVRLHYSKTFKLANDCKAVCNSTFGFFDRST